MGTTGSRASGQQRLAAAVMVLGAAGALVLLGLMLADTGPGSGPSGTPPAAGAREGGRPADRGGGAGEPQEFLGGGARGPGDGGVTARPLMRSDALKRLQMTAGALKAVKQAYEPPENAPNSPPPGTRISLPVRPPSPVTNIGHAEVKAAVQQVLPDLKSCYEKSLKMKDDAAGKVKVNFTLVASDGGAFMRDAEIMESDLGNPVAEACMLDALSRATFPAPNGEGEVRVTYPFNFAQ